MHSMRLCLSNYMNVPAHFTRDALHRVCKSFSIQTYLQVPCLCGNELSEELKQNGRLQLYIFYFFSKESAVFNTMSGVNLSDGAKCYCTFDSFNYITSSLPKQTVACHSSDSPLFLLGE